MIPAINIGFLEITWVDVIDIALVSVLLFQLYKLLKGSIASKIFLGLLSLYLIYLVVRAADMKLLTTILGQFTGVGVLAAIILFQQEIRKFLLLLGKTTTMNNRKLMERVLLRKQDDNRVYNINPVIEAVRSLSSTQTGALIVFAKTSELKFYAESGDSIDAELSKRLLVSIFNKTSPLHDGAVIIASGRIKAARCILPVTENDELPASYGMRHRAAIGMSEVTDSIIVVVSEETGQISLVMNGEADTNLSPTELRNKLMTSLFEDENELKRETERQRPLEEEKT